jgi:hypothetical protein
MSDEDKKTYDEGKASNEPEVYATAIPTSAAAAPTNERPIPAGHHRFYCCKCHTVRKIASTAPV